MRFLLFFLGLLLSGTVVSQAQINGKVIDALTGESLEYATVALYNASDNTLIAGVITDTNGVFQFKIVKPGIYNLEASFIGYQVLRQSNLSITNTNQPYNSSVFKLDIGKNELNEVVITGESAKIISKIDRQIYDTKVFTNARGGTGTDVIKNLPSVTIDGQGEINLRGSSGFVILINNKPVQGNATTILSQLPANAIERVEIITAPSAKYDPEGKAGILNIIIKKGAIDGAFTQISVRGGLPSVENYNNANPAERYGLDATYNLIKGKWAFSAGASYQRNDVTGRREGDVFTIINDTLTRFPSDGERSFDEVNYSGRFTVDYTPDFTNVITLGFFGGKRTKDRLADITYFDNYKISPVSSNNRISTFQYYNHNLRTRKSDFALGSLDYSHTFTNSSKLSTSFLYEYTLLGGPTENDNLGLVDRSIVYQKEYNTNQNPLNGIRVQLDYAFKPSKFGVVETGYQYRSLVHIGDFEYGRLNPITQNYELIPEFSSEVDLTRKIHSGYVQLSGKKNKWEYSLGSRLEHVDRDFVLKNKTNTLDTTYVYNYTKFFPSASAQYTFKNNLKLKAAYSKRVERTTTFKMNPFPEREHSETLEQGDPELRPEFIDVFELGINKKFKKGHTLFATAYYRHINNVVNRVNTIYNDTILNRIYTNVGKANAIGLEIGSELKVTKNWNSFIGVNIYNYNLDGVFNTDRINQSSTVYSINTNTTFKLWQNTSLQFTFNYLSERVTAQGEDSRFYSPNLTFQKSFFNDALTATLQWQHIDLGLLESNEQRITTARPNAFFTTTNYVYEVDVFVLNLTYTFNKSKDKSKFIDSEFGKREF
jgi:iron complex outermembrane receptor protein